MKLTIAQLRSIIKEEVTNKKLALARRNRALKEGGYVTSNMNPEEQLEAAVLAYLESKMTRTSMSAEGAHELLINEVEATYEMFELAPRGESEDGPRADRR